MMTVDMAQAVLELRAIFNRMQDPVPFFDAIGAMQVQKVKERIKTTKLDPDGEPWTPWAPFTADKRDREGTYDRGIMWETGRLLDSVRFDVDGAFGVDIGSDIWYAPKHQDGQGRLPKREIFGWDQADLTRIAVLFVNYVEGVRP